MGEDSGKGARCVKTPLKRKYMASHYASVQTIMVAYINTRIARSRKYKLL
jgi:hypothetical protein